MKNININPLSSTEWDIERGDVDFHVRLESDDYFVDSFDSRIETAEAAHLTTFRCDTWSAVEAYVCDFNPATKMPEAGFGKTNGYRA